MTTPDLFADVHPSKPATARREQPLELRAARCLCKRLRNVEAREDKQKIGHLICQSLIALCKKAKR